MTAETVSLILPYGPTVYMLRQRRGWRREDLALRMGQKGITQVWRLETGKVSPTVRTLEQFARGFGMPLSELVKAAEDFRANGPAAVAEPVVDSVPAGAVSYRNADESP